MDSTLLIGLFIALYLPMQIHLMTVDVFYGVFYFYLFIYCIFAVIGYVFVPTLSISMSAYFGTDIEQTLIIFLILSFVSAYVALLFANYLQGSSPIRLTVGRVYFNYAPTASALVAATLCLQITGLWIFEGNLSYSNANNQEFIESAGLPYRVWFNVFKQSPGLLIALYAIYRYRLWADSGSRKILISLFILELAVFMYSAHKLGNRLDVVSLLNGILFVELIHRNAKRQGLSAAFYTKAIFIALFCLAYLIWLSGVRTDNPLAGHDAIDVLIYQDYFPPAHMLIAAIGQNLTNLSEVLWSNLMNSLILMNYPYLQQYITDTFNAGVATRNTGYAFYVFTEGFLAFGMPGFLYNGIIVALGMWVWKRIASTNSESMNALILPVLAMDLVGLCRGQSAYFIKYLYIHLLPALFAIFLFSGYYLSGISFRRTRGLSA